MEKLACLLSLGVQKNLKRAILSIAENNYTEMSKNALAFFDNFDAEIVNKRILDQIMAL